jgi:aspartyl-tRNA(Asn)/glutamyl-tRNA(Gln) amidotransferase subunit C
MGKDQQIDVEYVARLARMRLTEEERNLFSKQMEDIFSYLDKLNELDTTGVEPTSHVIDRKNVFREDQAKPSLPKEEILAGAPDASDECFIVPKIIE